MVTTNRTSRSTRAGSKGGVVFDGLDAVVMSFGRESIEAPIKAGVAVVKYAKKANERMRNRVPIGPDDWHVLNSLTADETPSFDGKGIYADAGPDPAADEGAFVARFLEEGTVKQGPTPFIAPSVDETVPEFVKAIKDIPGL